MVRLNKSTLPVYTAGVNTYSDSETSYSPFYSNFGLSFDKTINGIGGFHLHYNRFSRVLWQSFAEFDGNFDRESSRPDIINFTNGACLAFFDTDAFEIEVASDKLLLLQKPDKMLTDEWHEELSEDYASVRGYSRNGDSRDPDEVVPFMLGIRAVNGVLSREDNVLKASCDKNGKIVLAFAFEVLNPDSDRIKSKVFNAPNTVSACSELCKSMICSCVDELDIQCTQDEAKKISGAINGLIENLAKAPGMLKNHISSYPSRGYSSHFLWDTCFQNLAYEELNKALAKDFLLQFKDCQRSDGKYMQFLCSTWARPHFSQPALVGWAVLRLYKKTGDTELLKSMLPSLEANNSWWLTSRMTRYGLISCKDGLETGQDDSPRFDDGDTLSCDMNSYLLSQINITAEIADILGDGEKRDYWLTQSKKLSAKMIELLYDENDNLFYDRNIKSFERVKVVSPVSLLPLWAGVSLDEINAKAMIERYLISPEYLFGTVPFPSVAYNEEKYEAGQWWRGPTWMPEAWLMLETLKKYGYEKEYEIASSRLLDVLMKDGKMHELFNSETGEGLGYEQQGWTCAIYLALLAEKQRRK